MIPLVAAVAAHRVLGPGLGLKWPNDVTMGEVKVAGILVESSDEIVVVGMGLNLCWPRPPAGAGALFAEDPGPERGPVLAEAWAEELIDLVALRPSFWPHDEYEKACVTIGRRVSWEPAGEGRAVGVDPDGALVVDTADGMQHLTAGAVRHVR